MSNVNPDPKLAVQIAQDVIGRVCDLDNKIEVRKNVYLSTASMYVDPLISNENLQDAIPELVTGSGCRVCALGAAILSLAHVRPYEPIRCEILTSGWIQRAMVDALSVAFSPYQLRLIEFAFEGDDQGGEGRVNTETYDKCEEFHDKYPDHLERLVAIMDNIIKNNGYFIL